MNWDHVRIFLLVAQTGTVSGAARLLGVSHATVLRNVARLEAHLDVRLFDHSPSGYRLTLAGQDILEDAGQMGHWAQRMIKRIRDRDRLSAGRLSVSMPESSIANLLPVIGAFCQAHPRIELNVLDAQGDADVNIRVTNQPPDHLIGRQIRRLDFAIFTAAAVGQTTPEQTRWVIWQNQHSGEEALSHQERWLRRLTPQPVIVLETQHHSQALEAVRSGLGAALLVAGEHTADMARADFTHRPVSQGLWMLTTPDHRGTARVSAFMQFVADNL